jgi:hypothetical protein
MIAPETARNDILPRFAAPLYNGYNVVKSQVFGGTPFPAVLAGVVVAGVNVGPAEFRALKTLADFYIFEKPQHAGHFDGEAYASDLAIVFGQNLHLALV